MLNFFSIFLLIILWPALLNAESRMLWEGGLWNLDYEGDTSTYGYFKILGEPDSLNDIGTVLKIEWIERRHNKNGQIFERTYASRLLPELNTFIGKGELKIKLGKIPSAIELTNDKDNKVWLRLWEPTRYELQINLK